MTPPERQHAVWLGDERVGVLHQRGDHTRFAFASSYLANPERPVLGLVFEQDLSARHAATLRLPCWFSNLLPEGPLRDWIASDRNVSPHREMELLAQVGHDLPGAVRITEAAEGELEADWTEPPTSPPSEPPLDGRWRFSLAGVGLKFSMLATGDRLTLPASGVGGDWIVKLPDQRFPDVPRNEFTMMSLAGMSGITVPEVRLVHRDELDGLPTDVWPGREEWAYAVRRFDRTPERRSVHIEDLAQVRNVYPAQKYDGNFETVAALVYRGQDVAALHEFARRIAFNVLISNGDAHLKNWSLIYTDPRVPTLAPAYDLVSARPYMGATEDLGLKMTGSRRFSDVRLRTFTRLEQRLAAEVGLAETADDTAARTVEQWPRFADLLAHNDALRADIESSIMERSHLLRRRPTR
ncbi:MAG: type II toxin-antitoxin system HipA family toxin [Actinomycetota bacterium]|nr:type II toxin-antitoxin system HipA family toxin [Actinomycetota bacterium]